MDAKLVSRCELDLDDVARHLDEGEALAGEPLEDEACAAEDPDADALLHVDAELDTALAADEAVAVDDVLLAAADLDGLDLARRLGGEDDGACSRLDRVARHEERAAADRALRGAEEAALLLAGAHARRQLHRAAHPGELARLGDHLVARGERDLENRRRSPLTSCCMPASCSVSRSMLSRERA